MAATFSSNSFTATIADPFAAAEECLIEPFAVDFWELKTYSFHLNTNPNLLAANFARKSFSFAFHPTNISKASSNFSQLRCHRK
jgi:hypothetical protein